MKLPRFAAVSIALDTQRYRNRRPDERRDSIGYLVDRLLAGEETATSELEHYGLRVTVREALGAEIMREER